MNEHHYYFSKCHQSHWSILQPHHNQPLIYKMFTLSGFVAVCPYWLLFDLLINHPFLNLLLLSLISLISLIVEPFPLFISPTLLQIPTAAAVSNAETPTEASPHNKDYTPVAEAKARELAKVVAPNTTAVPVTTVPRIST